VAESATDVAEAAAPPHGGRAGARAIALGILASARPRQWLKNVLLVAAPGAAGVLDEGDALVDVAIAFVAFCLVASGTYLLNDVRDAEADRVHPVKRLRPVAAGVVTVRVAAVAGVLLIAAGCAAALVVGLGFFGIVALYLTLTVAYTLVLKDIAVVDVAVVASGFVIRAVAGGVAVGVPISRWFLIVASFGSLFVVAGKRHGEHLDLGPQRAALRATRTRRFPGTSCRSSPSSSSSCATRCCWSRARAARPRT
jgi:decaprenyl-phosphate phosphoribosyltransferase